MIPSLVSLICCNGSQNSGKYFTYYYCFIIKDILKDTNKQSDDEVHRERSGRVLNAKASVLVEFRVPHSPGTWLHAPRWSLSESPYLELFMEVSLVRHV